MKISTHVDHEIVVPKREMYEVGAQCNLMKKDYASDEESTHDKHKFNTQVNPVDEDNEMQRGNERRTTINKKEDEKIKQILANTEEYRKKVLNSDDLFKFVDRNAKIMEKVLNEKEMFNIFKEYNEDEDENTKCLTKKFKEQVLHFKLVRSVR